MFDLRLPVLASSGLPFLILVAAAAMTPGASGSALEARIAERLKGFRGLMGVAARDLRSGEAVLVNADTLFPTASTIKIAVMLEVYHQMRAGRLQRDTLLALTEEQKVGGSGVLRDLHGGLQLSVADLLSLMITVSDNTATNLLIGLVGTANVDRRLEAHGLSRTRLFRPTFRDGQADVFPELEREFGLGVTTPAELARLMELIAEGKSVGRAASDEMLAILRRQEDRALIPRLLPVEEHRLVVGNKTGQDEEKLPDARGVRRHVRGDVALVEGPDLRYVVAILARQVEDTRWSVDNEALTTGAQVSRMIYDHFSRR